MENLKIKYRGCFESYWDSAFIQVPLDPVAIQQWKRNVIFFFQLNIFFCSRAWWKAVCEHQTSLWFWSHLQVKHRIDTSCGKQAFSSKGLYGWSSLLLSFLHQIPRTSTDSRTTPKHAFGTIQEMIAKETEIKFSSTINELFIAPKFKSNSTSLSEVEPSGGEKFQNSISTVMVSKTHTQNAKKIRIYCPLRFRFLVILNIGSLFVIFCLT